MALPRSNCELCNLLVGLASGGRAAGGQDEEADEGQQAGLRVAQGDAGVKVELQNKREKAGLRASQTSVELQSRMQCAELRTRQM